MKVSLSKHPDFFRKHPLICVNGFALSPSYTDLKPGYCVLLDPVLWQDDHEHSNKLIDAIIQSTTWELHLLVPQKAKNAAFVKRIRQHKHIKINFFNYTVFKGFTRIAHLLYSRNLAMPQCQNVLVATLFLGLNMHFKKIFLVGADHNWHENLHLNEANQLCLKDSHFYDNENKIGYRLFYKDTQHTQTFTMHEIMHTFSKVFYGHEQIKKYADYCEAAIYNASEMSFIDSFERKKIE
jgi:hypothetical protein